MLTSKSQARVGVVALARTQRVASLGLEQGEQQARPLGPGRRPTSLVGG